MSNEEALSLSQAATADYLGGQFLEECGVAKERAELVDNTCHGELGSDFVYMGVLKSKDCKKDYGFPICCPKEIAPASCEWRGGGKDCNGQYRDGEITFLHSR